MATFQNRDNGGVTAKIRMKGEKESQTFYDIAKPFKSAKKQAEEWATEVERQIKQGIFKACSLAKSVTLLQALDTYEKDFAIKNKGYHVEKYKIEAWRKWKYSTCKLSELSDSKFIEYRDKRRETVADSTIKLEFAVLSAVFKHTKYDIVNPAAEINKTLAVAKKRDRRLKSLEQDYLLAELFDTKCSDEKRANRYILLVVIFAIETACRLSEIVKDTTKHSTTGILIENVKLDKSIAKIFDTKNGADRFVPLTPSAVESITKAVELHNSIRGAVFNTTAGAVKQAWNRAKKRAIDQYTADGGKDDNFLKNFHFHDLRHEAASRWKKDFSIARLKDLTGHKDIRSLVRYLNSSEEDIEEMAQEMAEIQAKKKTEGKSKVIQFPMLKKA